jgi:hypothetical protein
MAVMPRWADKGAVEKMLKEVEDGSMNWFDEDGAFIQTHLKYPVVARCLNAIGLYSNHWIDNPAHVRKSTGTRRVGKKGRKMPTRGKCAGCNEQLVLIDNMLDIDFPLYINKLIIAEWP